MRITDQDHNRLKVLRELRRSEPLSRTDLAARSGLTGGTITAITASLLSRGLVLEEKVATSVRGRPRVNLRINPDGAYAIASFISIDGDLVSEIVNLRGEPVHRSSTALPRTRSLEELARTLAAIIGAVAAASPVGSAMIRCVGLALPAVVDTYRGVVHWVQTLEGSPFPAAALIEDRVGIPVTIDNNTNALARAEHWFGDDRDGDDFTLVNLGYGISASQYRDGQLALGVHGFNSEFGHSKIAGEDGLACSCGARGCVDAYCSLTGLARQICELRGEPLPPLAGLADTLSAFIADAGRGSEDERLLMARAGERLGLALSNYINMFGPTRMVVLSEQWTIPAIFRDACLDSIDRNCLSPFRRLTNITFGQHGDDLFRRGTAALVLEQLYRSKPV